MKYQKGTFITVPNFQVLSGVDGQAQVLFMWLCRYADEDGQCFPSVSTLAKNCGVSEATIKRKMIVLVESGFITRIFRKNKKTGANASNLYQIMLVNNDISEGGAHSEPRVGSQRAQGWAHSELLSKHNINKTKERDDFFQKSSSLSDGSVTEVKSEENIKQDLGDTELELVDEGGNPLEPVGFKRKEKRGRPRKDHVALKVQREFISRVKKEFGVEVPETSKGYFVVINAINKFGLDEAKAMDIVDEWFSLGKPEDETVHITHCFSEYQVTNYKVRNGA